MTAQEQTKSYGGSMKYIVYASVYLVSAIIGEAIWESTGMDTWRWEYWALMFTFFTQGFITGSLS